MPSLTVFPTNSSALDAFEMELDDFREYVSDLGSVSSVRVDESIANDVHAVLIDEGVDVRVEVRDLHTPCCNEQHAIGECMLEPEVDYAAGRYDFVETCDCEECASPLESDAESD